MAIIPSFGFFSLYQRKWLHFKFWGSNTQIIFFFLTFTIYNQALRNLERGFLGRILIWRLFFWSRIWYLIKVRVGFSWLYGFENCKSFFWFIFGTEFFCLDKFFIKRNVSKSIEIKIIWVGWIQLVWFLMIGKTDFFICRNHTSGLCGIIQWILETSFNFKRL